jgi:hypothetical protein
MDRLRDRSYERPLSNDPDPHGLRRIRVALRARRIGTLLCMRLHACCADTPLDLASDPVVVGFLLPERFTSAAQQAVGHDHEGAESTVFKANSAQRSCEGQLHHCLLVQELRPTLVVVQLAGDPIEHLPGRVLGGRRTLGMRKAAAQMPSEEQPAVWRIAVGKPPLRLHSKRRSSSETDLASTRHGWARALRLFQRSTRSLKTP